MSKEKFVQKSLIAVRKRNPDAFQILSAVSGITEDRLEELEQGAEPTYAEEHTLQLLA